jgi:CxxC motif-containing protein (DUF1111 family)
MRLFVAGIMIKKDLRKRLRSYRHTDMLYRMIFLQCLLSVSAAFPLIANAQDTSDTSDITLLGGELTSFLPFASVLQVAAPNVVGTQSQQRQLEGFSLFHTKRVPETGLGPHFIHESCGACHIQNGKGPVRINRGRKSAMVIKLGHRGVTETGAPRQISGFEEQMKVQFTRQQRQNRALRFRRLPRLRWRSLIGTYPDGTSFSLRRPNLRFRLKGIPKQDTVFSLRMSPGLVGLGLLEAIPEEQILAWSDPEDVNGDGISGVPQYVPNRATGNFELGRFGARGSHPTLQQQTAAAAFHDIGLTNTLFPDANGSIELEDDDLETLTLYQALGGVPPARDQEEPTVIAGKYLFQTAGCHDCHKMTVTTSEDYHIEPLQGQTIHPFTDLLLHDMGEDLADERAEFSASGREWRTSPLWGLGHLEAISFIEQRYLHDGRARSLEEAILWHGGEAAGSRSTFMNFSAEERTQLIAFLRSL